MHISEVRNWLPGWLRDHALPYFVVSLATLVVGLFVFEPWNAGAGILVGGGDGNWLMANYQVVGQVGIFGTDPHLAWPTGYTIWTLPQLGYSQLIPAWIMSKSTSASMLTVVLYVQVLTMVLCASSVLFLIRSLIRRASQMIAIVFSVGVGVSPYLTTETLLQHQNVSAFFAIPIVIGILVRVHDGGWKQYLMAAMAVAAVVATSPLWWVFVILSLLVIIGLGLLLQRRFGHVLEVTVIGIGVGLGALATLVPYALRSVSSAAESRGAWDSNVYGGHLSDLLVSSSALREALPALDSLVAGSSTELRLVGLLLVFGAAAATLLVLKGLPTIVWIGSRTVDTRVIAIGAVSSLLLFIGGGIGNLQAALAVFLGGASPARVWSRLIVVVSIFGVVWLCTYIARWWEAAEKTATRPRVVYGVVVAFLVVISVYEPMRGTAPAAVPFSQLPEFAAVNFIKNQREPCAVAQLPQDAFPTPRVLVSESVTTADLYYRPFIPYLIDPEYFWSYGSWSRKSNVGLNALPPVLNGTSKNTLVDAGFCAVLYDKELARAADKKGVKTLEGTDIRALGPPDFENSRYSVYLISTK